MTGYINENNISLLLTNQYESICISNTLLHHLTTQTKLHVLQLQLKQKETLIPEILITTLTTLYINYCNLDNLKILSMTPNLITLHANHNNLTSLQGIQYCTKLKTLNIYYNNITDLSYLDQLNELTYLNIYNNQIDSLNSLSHCTKLISIYIENNRITSLEPLIHCKNLNLLNITNNYGITDVTPLKQLLNLRLLYTSIYNTEILKTLRHLPNLIIWSNYEYNDDSDDKFHVIELEKYLYIDYIILIEKYLKLTQWSKEKDFIDEIINPFSFATEEKCALNSLILLEKAYDRLYYAPHGPNFVEGLKLCRG